MILCTIARTIALFHIFFFIFMLGLSILYTSHLLKRNEEKKSSTYFLASSIKKSFSLRSNVHY